MIWKVKHVIGSLADLDSLATSSLHLSMKLFSQPHQTCYQGPLVWDRAGVMNPCFDSAKLRNDQMRRSQWEGSEGQIQMDRSRRTETLSSLV